MTGLEPSSQPATLMFAEVHESLGAALGIRVAGPTLPGHQDPAFGRRNPIQHGRHRDGPAFAAAALIVRQPPARLFAMICRNIAASAAAGTDSPS